MAKVKGREKRQSAYVIEVSHEKSEKRGNGKVGEHGVK